MKTIGMFNNIAKHQSGMVCFVAVAYLGAPIVGKTLCQEVRKDYFQYTSLGSAPACHDPQEVFIPLAYVSGTSSGDAVVAVQLA